MKISPLESMIALLRMAIVDEVISPEWIAAAKVTLVHVGLGDKVKEDEERKSRGVMQP